MNSFFNANNPIFRVCVTIFDIIVLSIMWVISSLPIITIGTSTAALYYSAVKCVRFNEEDTFKNYLQAFRDNLRIGCAFSGIFLLISVGMFMIYTAIVGLLPLEQALSVPIIWGFLLFCVFLLAVFLCGVILFSRFNYSLSKLLSDAFRITFGHLPRVYLSAMIVTASLLLTIKFFFYQVWFATPCVTVLVISKLMEPVLRKYTPGIDNLMQLPLDQRPWYLK